MSDRPREGGITRRKLLLGLTTVGAAGALTGVGTGAYLNSRETFANNRISAGTVELSVDCPSDEGDCTVSDGRVSLSLADVRPGDSGVERIRFSVDTNPAWVWLHATCPPDETGLEDVVRATVWYDRNCDGALADGETALASGSLREVLRGLNAGVLTDVGCVSPGTQHCLGIEWEFPSGPDLTRYEGDAVTFELELYAVQCRHTDVPANPWADASPCPAFTPCTSCVSLGKADDFTDQHAVGDRHVLVACDTDRPSGYVLQVTAVDPSGRGIQFELLRTDGGTDAPGPRVCQVVVGGGKPPKTEQRPTQSSTDGTPCAPKNAGDPVAVDPPSATVDEFVFAPTNPNTDQPYAISNVVVAVCGDDLQPQ